MAVAGGGTATTSSPTPPSPAASGRSCSSGSSSFSRNPSSSSFSATANTPPPPGPKRGPNGATYVSSGIPDLDKILGGGFLVGSLVVIVEDADAPHHLLLLRNFMSQGLVHRQPLLFASPSTDPKAFLGTLPSPLLPSFSSSSSSSSPHHQPKDERPTPGLRNHSNAAVAAVAVEEQRQQQGLRIAWQYKKYFGEQQVDALNLDRDRREYCNEFDLRKPLERQMLTAQHIKCVSIQDSPHLAALSDHCSKFLSQLTRDSGISCTGRIAIQSLTAPQCGFYDLDWDVLSFIRLLRAMVRSSSAVAVLTLPTSVLLPSFFKRWQHLADTLLSVSSIPDEDKDFAKLIAGYQDMIGFLNVHKVAQLNTQVPVILEARVFSLKLQCRRSLILEQLNQAPIDGSSGTPNATSGGCSGSTKSSIDF